MRCCAPSLVAETKDYSAFNSARVDQCMSTRWCVCVFVCVYVLVSVWLVSLVRWQKWEDHMRLGGGGCLGSFIGKSKLSP